MFDIFKKLTATPAAFPLQVDMHSHILPGIDDGSPDLETSLVLIRGLIELGVKRSIATPHIIGDMYRNNPETIQNALTELRSGIDAAGINFPVDAAAEYMLDDYFFTLLDSGERLLTLRENYILTEFPFSLMPVNPERWSFRIITAGYQPILAHPERYGYYHSDPTFFHRLVELGFQLQVNLLSFTGYYGKEVQKAATYLDKHGLIAFAGTDLHHIRHLDALRNVQWKGNPLNNGW